MLHVRFEHFLAIHVVLGLILTSVVEAHLNLFMNETETMRLLGKQRGWCSFRHHSSKVVLSANLNRTVS